MTGNLLNFGLQGRDPLAASRTMQETTGSEDKLF